MFGVCFVFDGLYLFELVFVFGELCEYELVVVGVV